MTTAEKRALAAAVVLVLAAGVFWGWQSGTIRIQAGVDVGVADKDTADGRAARGHLCGDVPGVSDRHPLHRRHDGHAMRAALIQGGWDWYLNPPGEAQL